MGKRKLRNCAKCGRRHGPPTGKNCSRSVEELSAKNELEEDSSELQPSGENGVRRETQTSDDERDSAVQGFGKEEVKGKKIFNPGAFVDYDYRHTGEEEEWEERKFMDASHADRNGRRWEPPTAAPPNNNFERSMSDRMNSMENMLGRVAGIQQCQLERLIHLAGHPVGKADKKEEKTDECAKEEIAESTDSVGTDDEDYEWREYHGAEIWKKEKELKRRNPFDHKAYLLKGEKVDSFERLMSVTFRTVTQLLDPKSDVRGVVRHGRLMADKAYKKVYHLDAFTGYDEEVRERAARVGPSAFGKVVQEEVLTHFCYDNTIKAKQLSKPVAKQGRQRPEKTCHRFNDSVCYSKSCQYSHKCSSCGDGSHGKKDCKYQSSKMDRK